MGYFDEFECNESPQPEREPRLPRMLTVTIRGRRFGEMAAIARNLSNGGMGGTAKQWLMTSETIEVDLPGFGWTRARIAWTDGTRFGLTFLDQVEAGMVSRDTSAGMDPSFRVMDRFRPETSMRRPPLRSASAA